MLSAINIQKRVGEKVNPITILDGISFTVNAGEMVAIMGPSGCGKSTLLGILAGLDTPTEGRVVLDGQDLYGLPMKERDAFRNRHIGVIFQSHNLVQELNCQENVSLPWVFAGRRSNGVAFERIGALLAMVGLEDKRKLYPHQLSGGEQQRASVARALLMGPKILFADEPTGALDQANSRLLLRLMRESAKTAGCAVVLVTHDKEVADHCDRILTMRDGLLEGVGIC